MKLDKKAVKRLVQFLFSYLEMQGDLTIYFLTDEKMRSLHHQFFQDPSPTDCMSFPIIGELGEILVCPKTALTYAKKKSLDPYREVSLYIVHALLHLLGFDDLDPKQRRAMRKKEKSCIAYLDEHSGILTCP